MRLSIIVALATLAIASTATAQPSIGDAAARALFVATDTNKDGKWDKAEWVAAGRREMGFTFCDSSKDGFIDPAELRACAEKARAMGLTAQ